MHMDTQPKESVGIDELERKCNECISLMLLLCEEEIAKAPPTQDARTAALAHAAMSAQKAMLAFLTLAHIC
jgi:hypothetical protein